MKLNAKEIAISNASKELESIYSKISNLDKLDVGELKKDNTLIISVDLNNGFSKFGAMSSPRVEAIINKTVKFFELMKNKGIKIVAYTDYHDVDAVEFNSYPSHCLANTSESELVEEILPYVDLTIKKQSTNGFLAANPLIKSECGYQDLSQIDLDKIDKIIFTGDCTDICVYQFAITMKTYLNQVNRDCEVIVLTDFIETYHLDGIHDSDLNNLVFVNSLIANGVKVYTNIKGENDD